MNIWQRLFGGPDTAGAGRSPAPPQEVGTGSLDVYRSKRFHFTICRPVGWDVIYDHEKQGEWTIPVGWAGPATSEGRPAFLVNVRESEVLNRNRNVRKMFIGRDGKSWTAPTTPQEYIELSRSSIPFADLRHESDRVLALAGMEATELTYSYRGSRGRVRERTVTLFGMSATYQFVAEAPDSRFNDWLPLFETLISSFTLGTEAARPLARLPSEPLPAAPDTAISLYNLGVDHFDAGRFAPAEETFARAFKAREATLPVQMAAAYARAICLGQLRRPVAMPEELDGKSDATGCTYLAYTAAGHLVRDRHAAAVKSGDSSVVDAKIGTGTYRFAFSSFFGNFSVLASRMEQGGAVRVSELAAKPGARREDIYANELLEKLRSGSPRPVHIPSTGFPESL